MFVLPYSWRTLALKMFFCVALVATADVFFYGHAAGWTAGCYALLLLAAVTLPSAENKSWLHVGLQVLCALLAASALALPAGVLSTFVFISGLLILQVAGKRRQLSSSWTLLQDISCFLPASLRQWRRDVGTVKKLRRLHRAAPLNIIGAVMVTLLPLVLAAGFLGLFSYANPVIAKALSFINVDALLPYLSPLRWFAWFCLGIAIWALLRPRFRLPAKPLLAALPTLGGWVNRQSIIWSLALFNILFALQNGLDIAFLWQHEALPEGLTYAEYAHAGAYPLIITALVAAAYVLLTFSDQRYTSKAAKWLVLAWVAQNIFLVISAIDRTLNYIDIYALTYLRLAALIWMGLVATGLGLITLRVIWNRSNLWLLDCNIIALAATLYACCFINFDAYIARYNVVHSDVSGKGAELDIEYLASLGPDAIEPLWWYAQNTPNKLQASYAENSAYALETSFKNDINNNWRGWTWHKSRLLQDIQAREAR